MNDSTDDRGQEARSLVRHIQQAIEAGQLRPGDKISPIRDLAQQYQLSFSAVREALGSLQELGLIQSRQGSGTYVAQQVGASYARSPQGRRPGEGEVALFVSAHDHVFGDLHRELSHELQAAGVPVRTMAWRNDRGIEQLDEVLARWREDPPQAIVLHWFYEGLDKAIAEACAGRTRIITVFRAPFTAGPAHSVDPDQDAAEQMALDHLISLGHRRIGLILNRRIVRADHPYTLRKRTVGHTATILRFGHALRRLGRSARITLYYQPFVNNEQVDAFSETNRNALADWLARRRPTAIYGPDFRVAPVVHAASRVGLSIPKHLYLLGLGNTPWSKSFGFSSISTQEGLIAHQVAEIVLSDRDEIRIHAVIPPKLVLR